MSATSRGLGRGLDALFQNNPVEAEGAVAAPVRPVSDTQKVAVTAIAPNPKQPRHHFVEAHLDELAASIKAQGVLQPILVRPVGGEEGKYEIIAGERRWRAAQKAGLSAVPVVVRNMNDQEVLIVALMENLQREDLNPMEEALGLQQLKEEFGLSQEDMAERLGKSRSAIANTIRLAGLPQMAQDDLATGKISAGHARALLSVTDPEALETFRTYLVASQCTVREAEKIAAHWKDTGSLPENMASPAVTSTQRTAKSVAVNEALASLQERIGAALDLPVSIKGKESKGKISVSYSSKEELETLLSKLGVRGDDA
ncbi:MAG: putative chromosome-partitioning protein ParB [Desulfovibrio sp.]